MRYCHDCGAKNEPDAELCRICGHSLRAEQGSHLCTTCGEYLVEGANFCSACGAAQVTARRESNGSLPGSLAVETAVAAERQAAAARIESAVSLSDGLELPDWLKRAAAEQPYDPSQATVFPAELAPPTAAAMNGVAPSLTVVSTSDEDQASGAPESTRPAIPDGDLGSALPDWLQQPPAASVETAAEAAPSAPVARDADLADTSTFISESDLPEWIRQLAEADESKRAEEARALQADAATTARDASGRRRLPGETPAAKPAANPWLARRERVAPPDDAASPWTSLRAAEAAESKPDEPASEERFVAEPEAAAPEVATPPLPRVAAETSTPSDSRDASRWPTLRIILAAAVILAILALAASLALGG
ncbi:MAG TPA: zinc-ribbon domain-containing protein [Thermomicrobiales bacterium]